MPDAPATADLSLGLMSKPPKAVAGECWASDITPAVIETVTEQVVVSPAVQAEDGSLISPASFRSETRQSIVRERSEVWFRTPCPEDLTPDFIATLQRALKARGFYLLPLTATLDPATNEAVRRFQEPLGLDSPRLSWGAARALGIVATGLDEL